MTCKNCDHPTLDYYLRMGFNEAMAEKIIEGFHVPNDYPTDSEILKYLEHEQ